jgi:ABC-type oligopeptide transport system ATPase subunit
LPTERLTQPSEDASDLAVRVRNLVKIYPIGEGRSKGELRAVDDVSFDIPKGQTLGIVGESGSGKSTTAMIVAGLNQPTSGEVLVGDKNLAGLKGSALRDLRREVQVVFQDPHSSLDPRMSIGAAIDEPLYVHAYGSKSERANRVGELLELVGLPEEYRARYPHQMSGGQAQRVCIARALALQPSLMILDEPVASLDLSIQAQVINLLRRLQRELSLSYLFIGHDLAAVASVSDLIAVMHQGKMVEQGPVERVFSRPEDPYTRKLFDAVLAPETDLGRFNPRQRLQSEVDGARS